MEQKHTPGPWRVGLDYMLVEDGSRVNPVLPRPVCKHCGKTGDERAIGIQVIAAGPFGVATLETYEPAKDHDTILANARLIACAPELLAFVRKIEEDLSLALDETDQDTGQTYYEQARALIAKVTEAK